MSIDPRTPVLVGVGTASADADADELMAEALRQAGREAGSATLLSAIDRIEVPKGTWTFTDPARLVARRVGSPRATTWLGTLGVSQQCLVTEGLRAIAEGRCDVVAVVGGEARARQVRAAKRGETAPASWVEMGTSENQPPDVMLEREPDFLDPTEVAAGLVQPVAQYAMIENALARADGTPTEVHRRHVAELWERFNVVASGNPKAAFGLRRSAEQIAEPSDTNRPLAYPYNKWHASQWTVDQSAALLLCSVEAARAHGVASDRWVFPLVGLDAGCAIPLSRRRDLHRWPAMAVLGRAASTRIERPLAEIELIEVYSCFPSAVQIQQRELGLPTDGTPTVTGGMSFAGGPLNNFVYQSTAAIIEKLRESDSQLAAVTTVCGLLTKPGLAVWSTAPDGRPPLLEDLGDVARRETPVVEVVGDYRGPATVATFTVTPDPSDQSARPGQMDRTLIVADLPDGRRTVAVSLDPALAAEAVVSGFIGRTVEVDGLTFTA